MDHRFAQAMEVQHDSASKCGFMTVLILILFSMISNCFSFEDFILPIGLYENYQAQQHLCAKPGKALFVIL